MGDLVRVIRGISYRSPEVNTEGVGTPFLNLKSVDRGGGYRPEGLKFFTGTAKPEQAVAPGDLLIAVTDLTRDKAILGCPLFVPDGSFTEGTFSLDLARLVVDEDRADVRYLAMALQSDEARTFMQVHSSGTTVIHLKMKDLPRLMVPLPPLAAQRRVVDMMTAMDDLMNALVAERESVRALQGAVRGEFLAGSLEIPPSYDALLRKR